MNWNRREGKDWNRREGKERGKSQIKPSSQPLAEESNPWSADAYILQF